MLFFSKKSPEEKEKQRIEKLRRTEGERGFGGALMTPVGDLNLADLCIVRLDPAQQCIRITCQKKEHTVPYSALVNMNVASESQIAKGESPITAEEMNALIEGEASAFVGALEKDQIYRARWFIRICYTDADGAERHLIWLAYSMRGPYMASSKLYAAAQFEETFADILSRGDL